MQLHSPDPDGPSSHSWRFQLLPNTHMYTYINIYTPDKSQQNEIAINSDANPIYTYTHQLSGTQEKFSSTSTAHDFPLDSPFGFEFEEPPH